ncbi:MAG: amidohydrolase family protein [Proteobacteria bacterium]|nr:amidohydrolase family protein [Pseudomonadota bacterium]
MAYAPALGTPLQVIPEMFNTKEGYGRDYLWFIGASTRGVDSSYPSLTTTIEPPAIAKKIKNREVLKAGFLQFIEDHVATGGRFVNTHIAGDKTLDLVMDAIERGSKRAGLSPEQIRAKRHAGDHCTMNPRPDQIPRIKKLGMIMSCSPKYIRRAGKVLRDYGEVFLDWVVPVKSLIDAGVRTVLEIDDRNMGDYGSVFNYIDLLVNRKHKGYTYAGKERIDRVLALKMSTIWAAEYVLREKLLGSLERGKFADLIVLSDDYLTVPTEKIKNIKPVLTVVGGKIVYQAPEF